MPSNMLDTFPFLSLPKEIRLSIYELVVYSERPFLIGRYEEEKSHQHRATPRDHYICYHAQNLQDQVVRDDTPNRPVHPAISRTCRLIRDESLAMFHNINEFWLIHNDLPSQTPYFGYRAFTEWLLQTSEDSFDQMSTIQLCGYDEWPTRIIIRLNLKQRVAVSVRRYTIYGDQLDPGNNDITQDINLFVMGKDDYSSSELLRAVIQRYAWIYVLHNPWNKLSERTDRHRLPASGIDFDW